MDNLSIPILNRKSLFKYEISFHSNNELHNFMFIISFIFGKTIEIEDIIFGN